MKTLTRSQILEIVSKTGPIRPADLVQKLKLSPQAIHRHLRSLVAEELIEPRGRPPTTQYVAADRPDFSRALAWFHAKHPTPSSDDVCETRDLFAARLSRFAPLVKRGVSENDLSLIISVSGEVGNNSFDHNLGQWRDVPGCWFEIQVTLHRLWVVIADRGQGVFASLSRAVRGISDEQEALRMAFEERVSGRAPEQRGNGLKFVRNVMTAAPGRGIACRSGSGLVEYGDLGSDCAKVPRSGPGTVTVTTWRLK